MAKENVPVKQESESRGRDVERWAPLASLREEIDELFDEFTSGWPMSPFRRRRGAVQPSGVPAFGWMTRVPAFDVVDKDQEIEIRADLPPGVDKDDVDVRVTDGSITISGEKKDEREEGEREGSYYLSERRYGSFQRTIPLPEGIDHEKIDASFRKGVLTVHLPKTAEAKEKSKRIEVKGE